MEQISKKKVIATFEVIASFHPFERKINRPNYYSRFHINDTPDFQNEDANAIAKDWAMVGKDISRAIDEFKQKPAA